MQIFAVRFVRKGRGFSMTKGNAINDFVNWAITKELELAGV